MTANAVQTFALELYDGLSSPYLDPLKAYILPEPVGGIGQPQMHLWIRNASGKRLTMTRGSYTGDLVLIQGTGGNRTAEHELMMWVTVMLELGSPNANEAFPCLIGNILKKAWAVKLVQLLNDPTTNEQSGLTDFGEKYTFQQAPPLALESEGPVRLGALVTLSVRENFPG